MPKRLLISNGAAIALCIKSVTVKSLKRYPAWEIGYVVSPKFMLLDQGKRSGDSLHK